jgi:putative transposase
MTREQPLYARAENGLQRVQTIIIRRLVKGRQKYQNNRAENSHQPIRLRESMMRRFKSAGHAQPFISAFGIITSHFRVGRHLYRASGYREVMKSILAIWEEVIHIESAA